MKKTMRFLLVLTVLIALVAMAADARIRRVDTRIQQAVDIKSHAIKQTIADDNSGEASRFAPVGYAASKLSPLASRGSQIALTYNDVPANVTAGNLVAVNPPTVPAQIAGIHFGYRAKALPGAVASAPLATNRMGYAAFDPYTGTFPFPGGVPVIADASATSWEGGSTARVMAYPDGRAILSGYSYPDGNTIPDSFYIQVTSDAIPMAAVFGDIATGGSLMNNTKNIEQSWTAGTQSLFPYSVLDINGSGASDTIIYLMCDGGHANRWYDQFKVFRKNGTTMPGGVDASWELVFTDSTYGFTNIGIACDPTSARVAVATTLPYPGDTSGASGNDIYWWDSPSGNSGTWIQHNLTNLTSTSVDRPWMEVVPFFDTQGELHLIWNATYYTGVDPYNTINSVVCRGLHWYELDGSTNVFYDARWSPGTTCGRLGFNVQNIGMFAIGECENRLYISFSSANDPAYVKLGDTGDCAISQTAPAHRGAGDVYVTVSKDRSGKSWDKPRELSFSHTGPCDTGLTNTPCTHDVYSSMTPYGIHSTEFVAGQNWSNGGADWDMGDATYTGGRFLNVFYLSDVWPGRAGNLNTGGIVPPYTENNWRWVRMMCAPPVVAAAITLSQDSITFPEWENPSTPKTYTIYVNSTGNTDAIFSSVTDIEDSTRGVGAGPTNWMSIASAPTTILEGKADTMTVTLNAGGVITSGPTVLFGKVRFQFGPPAATKDLGVKFIVADTLVASIWDTVSTACLDLMVGTNGNMGNSGADGTSTLDSGRYNMDYAGTAGECDAGANSRGSAQIYLYDASPIIIRKTTSPATIRGSWSSWSENWDQGHGFKPVTGFANHGAFSTASYDGFNSGTFVTTDSLVKVECTWWAPKNADSCNFIIQRTRLIPYTIGSAVTGLQMGFVADWDVPTDSGGSNNVSGTDNVRRMAYMRGFNSGDTVTDCADNSKRYGGMALLNWHLKNKTCYDSLFNAVTFQNAVYVYGGVEPDSMSRLMSVAGYTSEPAITDLSALLTVRNNWTLPANDTFTVYSAYATTRPTSTTTATGLDTLKKYIDKSKEFMKKNLNFCSSCCVGVTGNVNTAGIVDLSDLSSLVSYLTGGGYVLPCPQEANVNNAGIVDLSDLSSLVSYLTGGGYVLPNCG